MQRRLSMLLFLSFLALLMLTSCLGEGDVSCSPPPQISSWPPDTATVGQQYSYCYDASYLCGMWSICSNIVGIQLPPGAVIDEYYDCILWTPDASYAGMDVQFAIATGTDDCGDRATQSWTVHVN